MKQLLSRVMGVGLLLAGIVPSCRATPEPAGMVWVPGGEFTMGSDREATSELCTVFGPKTDAGPEHRVWVSGFWMDTTEVTNAQFAAFVAATGYVTVAERTPLAADFPGVPGEIARGRCGGLQSAPSDGEPYGSESVVALRTRCLAGSTPRGPGAPGGDANTILSCRSRGPTRQPMPDGPASACRRRPNGSEQRGAGWTASPTPGETILSSGWPVDGQYSLAGSFPRS